MNKNFSQGFVKDSEPSFAALLIRDLISRKFLLLTSNEQRIDESDFSSALNCELYLGSDIALQLAKKLYDHDIMLGSYRELARNNRVEFSFIDDTPGYITNEVCYYVEADIPNLDKLSSKLGNQNATLVTFDELVQKLQASPVSSYISIIGASQIKNELMLLK